MSETVEFRQELPPKGGFDKIHYQRVPAKSFFNGYKLFAGYIGVTTISAYVYYLNCKAVKAREVEMRGAYFAIFPMLLAERDRAYLKQLRRNRDEETKLMANVEGWKTGTWYGEPIYHGQPADKLFDPRAHEYYIHASYKDFARRAELRFLS